LIPLRRCSNATWLASQVACSYFKGSFAVAVLGMHATGQRSEMFLPLLPITPRNAPLPSADSDEVKQEDRKADAKTGKASLALSHQVEQAPSGDALGAKSAIQSSVDEAPLENGFVPASPSSPSSPAAEDQLLHEQLLANDSLGG
jgi:hypothetical protein